MSRLARNHALPSARPLRSSAIRTTAIIDISASDFMRRQLDEAAIPSKAEARRERPSAQGAAALRTAQCQRLGDRCRRAASRHFEWNLSRVFRQVSAEGLGSEASEQAVEISERTAPPVLNRIHDINRFLDYLF